ncbi:MAG: hypothetical protein A3F17_06995 [Gammaproteobacteria bacterium RIFCSPHIGHO2_12_FULL_41_15]|nr:MAG: hypothetical protein A3F17_06995 [Gammaproteobacteria bacterium RIFCSPHIGHO2_12_FULL_41_15]
MSIKQWIAAAAVGLLLSGNLMAERYDPRNRSACPQVSELANNLAPEYRPGQRARNWGGDTCPQQISPYDILLF